MRFIQINEELQKSSYENILKFNCGPDFVFQRSSVFKMMIKEQGLKFWFRFWLTFCFNPSCPELKWLQDQWSLLSSCANIHIHEHFLQGSVEDAANYSLDTAIKSLTLPINSFNKKQKPSMQKSNGAREKPSINQTWSKLPNKPTLKPSRMYFLSVPKSSSRLNFKRTILRKPPLGRTGRSKCKSRLFLNEQNYSFKNGVTAAGKLDTLNKKNKPSVINKNSNSDKINNCSKKWFGGKIIPKKSTRNVNAIATAEESEILSNNSNANSYNSNFLNQCFDRKIKSYKMVVTGDKPRRESTKSAEHFRELLQECTEMAFGAALCVIFYKWLVAREMDIKYNGYWKIPGEYFHSKFKPGAIEDCIVKHWDTKLPFLLGVIPKQIPWLASLLLNPRPLRHDNVDKSEFPAWTQDSAKFMKQHINEKRLQFLPKDSINSKISEKCVDNKNQLKNTFPKRKKSKKDVGELKITFRETEDIRNKCFYCNTSLLERGKFKKICKHCLTEKWLIPRHYCSDMCKLEHWFTEHSKEHCADLLKE